MTLHEVFRDFLRQNAQYPTDLFSQLAAVENGRTAAMLFAMLDTQDEEVIHGTTIIEPSVEAGESKSLAAYQALCDAMDVPENARPVLVLRENRLLTRGDKSKYNQVTYSPTMHCIFMDRSAYKELEYAVDQPDRTFKRGRLAEAIASSQLPEEANRRTFLKRFLATGAAAATGGAGYVASKAAIDAMPLERTGGMETYGDFIDWLLPPTIGWLAADFTLTNETVNAWRNDGRLEKMVERDELMAKALGHEGVLEYLGEELMHHLLNSKMRNPETWEKEPFAHTAFYHELQKELDLREQKLGRDFTDQERSYLTARSLIEMLMELDTSVPVVKHVEQVLERVNEAPKPRYAAERHMERILAEGAGGEHKRFVKVFGEPEEWPEEGQTGGVGR